MDFSKYKPVSKYDRYKVQTEIPKSESLLQSAIGQIPSGISEAITGRTLNSEGLTPGQKFARGAIARQMQGIIPQLPSSITDVQSSLNSPFNIGQPINPNSITSTASNTVGRGLARQFGTENIQDPLLKTGADIALDIAPNIPAAIVIGGPSAVKGIAKGARGIGGWLAEPYQRVGKIKSAASIEQSGINSLEKTGINEAQRIGGMRKGVLDKFKQEEIGGIREQESYLKKSIGKSADEESLALQKELPQLYSNKSAKIGSELKELVGDKPIPIKTEELIGDVENALAQHGILRPDENGRLIQARAPIDSDEIKILNMYKNWKENPGTTIDAQDLLKAQEAMKVKYNKPRSGGEQLMSTVKENISRGLEPHVPGLSEKRSSWAPYLKVKRATNEALQPFAGQYGTKKSSAFFSKVANPPESGASVEKRLLGHLEKELGRDIGKKPKAFGERLRGLPEKEEAIKFRAQQAKQEIDNEIENIKIKLEKEKLSSTSELEKRTEELIRQANWSKFKRGGLVAVASALPIFKYARHKIFSWLTGMPSKD